MVQKSDCLGRKKSYSLCLDWTQNCCQLLGIVEAAAAAVAEVVVVQQPLLGCNLAAVGGKHSDILALVAAVAAVADIVLAVGVRVPAAPDDTEQTAATFHESSDGCSRTQGKQGCIPAGVAGVAAAVAAAVRIAELGRVAGKLL